jgi:2'-5' RNA ligase
MRGYGDTKTRGRGDPGTRGHGDGGRGKTEMRRSGDTGKRDADSRRGDTEVVQSSRACVPASPRHRITASSRQSVPASPRHRVPLSPLWRVFCAVEIPEKVGALVAMHVRKLQTEFPSVAASWSREGKFHLTLKFFGNVPLARLSDISSAASVATAGISEFKIKIGGAGAFPKHGPPRVLWLGIEDLEGRLSQLQERLEHECVSMGFEREARTFHPHLTLARLRKPEGAKALALAHTRLGFEEVYMTISEVLVIRSELNPKGAKYSQISKHCLSAA